MEAGGMAFAGVRKLFKPTRPHPALKIPQIDKN